MRAVLAVALFGCLAFAIYCCLMAAMAVTARAGTVREDRSIDSQNRQWAEKAARKAYREHLDELEGTEHRILFDLANGPVGEFAWQGDTELEALDVLTVAGMVQLFDGEWRLVQKPKSKDAKQ